MANREIWHEIMIRASQGELYQALTEVKKLAQWWTTDARGEPEVGKNLEFWFSGFCQTLEVTKLKPNELVQWRATQKEAPEWAGTEIEFKIFRESDRTLLHFRQSGFREDAKMFPRFSLRWAIFLLSLKEFVETEKGRPYPYEPAA